MPFEIKFFLYAFMEDSDQPAIQPSLITLFAVRMAETTHL